ncbi:restriction endonuclease subunit S [Desulfoscipio sp. XC116]|uniref:restriction endonuclease subunit S n=1 Tax=Desulfoscipio sp. XC116 TaxID=3144975 RepID=UPI00325C2736
MSENKENVPQIRFPGFSDAWEQRRLGEIATFINGRAYSQDELLAKGKYKVLRVGNFYTNDSWYYSDMELGEKHYANVGDLLYTWSASFGPHIWLGDKVIYHYHIWKVALSEQFDKQFAVQILDYDRAKLMSDHNGSTMIHITKKGMEEKTISLPSTAEQKRIGTFFCTLDNLITLHQRKLNNVKKLKAGLLQKMFPKNGEKFPEVRFPEFTHAWEQRKLGELAEFSKGSGYTKNDLTESGSPIVLYGRLYTKYETIINDVDTFVEMKDNSVISEGNEVVVPASGETAEDISRASVIGRSGFILGGDLNIIKPNQEIDPIFLALTISGGTQQKEMSKCAQGKSVVHLHNSDLKQVSLFYPKLEEQQRIGKFFVEIDRLITLHQRKLEHLQKQKKSLLQQMFL